MIKFSSCSLPPSLLYMEIFAQALNRKFSVFIKFFSYFFFFCTLLMFNNDVEYCSCQLFFVIINVSSELFVGVTIRKFGNLINLIKCCTSTVNNSKGMKTSSSAFLRIIKKVEGLKNDFSYGKCQVIMLMLMRLSLHG